MNNKKVNATEKRLSVKNASGYTPSPAELKSIEKHLKHGASSESLNYYEWVAATTLLDYDGDVLKKSFLEWMGEKYEEGRAIVFNHDSTLMLGYTFSSEVIKHEKRGHYKLLIRGYIPNESSLPTGIKAVEAVNTGILRRGSVSFFAIGKRVQNDQGQTTHYEYSRPEKNIMADVREFSLVALGAQQEAHIKAMNDQKEGKEKPSTFDVNSKTGMEKLEIKVKSLGKTHTFELPEEAHESIKSVISILDTRLEKAIKELKKFQEAEQQIQEEKAKKLVNLRKIAYGEEAIDAEKEVEMYSGMTSEFLASEIVRVEKLVKDMKKELDTSDADSSSKEQGGEDSGSGKKVLFYG